MVGALNQQTQAVAGWPESQKSSRNGNATMFSQSGQPNEGTVGVPPHTGRLIYHLYLIR